MPRIAPSPRARPHSCTDHCRRGSGRPRPQLRPAGRCAGDLANGPAGGLQEHRLAEQVGAGVARDAKLGKDDQIAIGCEGRGARMISAALAAGSATVTRGEAQVMRRKPCRFIWEQLGRHSTGLLHVGRDGEGTEFVRPEPCAIARSSRGQIDRASASRVEQGATCINGLAELDREPSCPG